MKKTIYLICSLALVLMICLGFASCNGNRQEEDLWSDAMYTEDTELGSGAKTIQAELKAGEKSITFTIKTDKATLGEALAEHNLVSGENSPYGLYIKSVNGIRADYDIDKAFWALTKDGQSLLTAADKTEISDKEHYEIVYTK